MPAQTPPVPKRILFLSMYHLGWKTLATQIEEYAGRQRDLEISCVRVAAPFWLRLLTHRWPGRLGFSLLRPEAGWRWFVAWRYRALVLRGEFDVVYANSQCLALGLLKLCRRANAKLVVAVDVTGAAHSRDLCSEEIPSGRRWREEELLYQAACLVVPMSRWIADSLVNDLGVAREKIFVMPPVVDPARFPVPVSIPASTRPLPRLLFCGDDWQRKGGERLLRWHQQHWADIAELHILSGKAAVRPGLKNVVVHGHVPYDRWLNDVLPAAEIFCLPTWQDMSPYAVSEAQAAGLPTVSSRLGSIPELVLDGKTGFLLAPDDEAGFIAAIWRLLRDPGLRQKMGCAARAHAQADLNADVLFHRLFDRLVTASVGLAA